MMRRQNIIRDSRIYYGGSGRLLRMTLLMRRRFISQVVVLVMLGILVTNPDGSSCYYSVDAYKMGELIDMNVYLTIGWGGGLGLLKQHRMVSPLTRLEKPKFALTRRVTFDYRTTNSNNNNNNNNNPEIIDSTNNDNDDDKVVTAIQFTFEDTYWVLSTLSTIQLAHPYAIVGNGHNNHDEQYLESIDIVFYYTNQKYGSIHSISYDNIKYRQYDESIPYEQQHSKIVITYRWVYATYAAVSSTKNTLIGGGVLLDIPQLYYVERGYAVLYCIIFASCILLFAISCRCCPPPLPEDDDHTNDDGYNNNNDYYKKYKEGDDDYDTNNNQYYSDTTPSTYHYDGGISTSSSLSYNTPTIGTPTKRQPTTSSTYYSTPQQQQQNHNNNNDSSYTSSSSYYTTTTMSPQQQQQQQQRQSSSTYTSYNR